MARKKKQKSPNYRLRFALKITTTRLKRLNSKHRRSRSYWHKHSECLFSKIHILDVERLWLDVHTPDATIELRQVDNPDQYPRYRAGLWDGMAYFVTFPNPIQASQFKVAMWSKRR